MRQYLLACSACRAGWPSPSRWRSTRKPKSRVNAGASAELLALAAGADGLRGVPASRTLDALVFATDAPAFAEVYVACELVVAWRPACGAGAIGERFDAAMAALRCGAG